MLNTKMAAPNYRLQQSEDSQHVLSRVCWAGSAKCPHKDLSLTQFSQGAHSFGISLLICGHRDA